MFRLTSQLKWHTLNGTREGIFLRGDQCKELHRVSVTSFEGYAEFSFLPASNPVSGPLSGPIVHRNDCGFPTKYGKSEAIKEQRGKMQEVSTHDVIGY